MKLLVLARKPKETIQIGNDITITIVRIEPGNVRIGVDAPKHMPVLRSELNRQDAEPPLGERLRSLRPESGDCTGA